MTMQGRKDDAGKQRWSLIPIKALSDIVDVLTFGAKKYTKDGVDGAGNWQKVPDGQARYTDALFRHLAAWRSGELCDEETGLSHLAHAGCCLLFLAWYEEQPIPLVVRKESTCTVDGMNKALTDEAIGSFVIDVNPHFAREDAVETVKPSSEDDESPPTQRSRKGARALRIGDKMKTTSPWTGKRIVRTWTAYDADGKSFPKAWRDAGWTHEDGTEIADGEYSALEDLISGRR